MEASDIRTRIRSFIEETYLFEENSHVLDDDDSLVEGNIIDSAAVLTLIIFLEEEFEIQVEDNEVMPDNLDTVNRLTTFVQTKAA